ncbi:MAG: hypothetical protein JSS55_17330 [Proteobacteria bacterium]|nr:hypothetical protein [Pseudomonadota bacterium]
MEWLIGIAVVALVIFFLANGRRDTVPTVRQHTRSAQERAKSLPEDEKDELSAEVRELALEQYDMASAKAKEAGKDDAFAHQVGVLRAVSAVIVQGERVDPYREQELQMETVPFNKLPPDEGRRAVSEYLVYKFFPDRADERSFSPALASFKRQLSADAEKQNDPDG